MRDEGYVVRDEGYVVRDVRIRLETKNNIVFVRLQYIPISSLLLKRVV